MTTLWNTLPSHSHTTHNSRRYNISGCWKQSMLAQSKRMINSCLQLCQFCAPSLDEVWVHWAHHEGSFVTVWLRTSLQRLGTHVDIMVAFKTFITHSWLLGVDPLDRYKDRMVSPPHLRIRNGQRWLSLIWPRGVPHLLQYFCSIAHGCSLQDLQPYFYLILYPFLPYNMEESLI